MQPLYGAIQEIQTVLVAVHASGKVHVRRICIWVEAVIQCLVAPGSVSELMAEQSDDPGGDSRRQGWRNLNPITANGMKNDRRPIDQSHGDQATEPNEELTNHYAPHNWIPEQGSERPEQALRIPVEFLLARGLIGWLSCQAAF
ncbi:hypothetical protein [Pseudomonas aeruginosa]|uniref:hypothetical protein n=1 Tax=Pseudomonas aeruginosa TaxID=287 RepID=UPI0040468F3D|nr:hypothetical protein [Pseudomonas aeruginosa]